MTRDVASEQCRHGASESWRCKRRPLPDSSATFDVAWSPNFSWNTTAQSVPKRVAQLASAISGALTEDDTDKWGVSDPAGGAWATFGGG